MVQGRRAQGCYTDDEVGAAGHALRWSLNSSKGGPTPAIPVCQGEGEAHTAPQEHAEVFTGEGVLWACWANGEGSARVGPGLGQQ